jgi:hypothetical protein
MAALPTKIGESPSAELRAELTEVFWGAGRIAGQSIEQYNEQFHVYFQEHCQEEIIVRFPEDPDMHKVVGPDYSIS